MGISTIKAVVFDMDGLLIDTEKLLLRFWLEAAHQLGYPMEKKHVYGIRSLSAKFAEPKLQKEVCPEFDYYKVRNLRRKLMQEYIEIHGVEEKKGLGELLAYLKEHHYKTAVATATELDRTTQYLSSLGRLEAFDKIICASMVPNGKPEPDIYLEAARQLGIAPAECMALEDSPNGILSAYRAGFYPVMVPDLTQPDEETQKLLYACVADLSQVIPLLQQEQ